MCHSSKGKGRAVQIPKKSHKTPRFPTFLHSMGNVTSRQAFSRKNLKKRMKSKSYEKTLQINKIQKPLKNNWLQCIHNVLY
jgi:hypothetical protein